MSDDNDPWKAGHQNRQWQYGMDTSEFNAGREQREREEAERQRQWREADAARNAPGNSGSSPSWGSQSNWRPATGGGGGGGEAAGGIGILALIGGGLWLLWTLFYVFLGAAFAVAVMGTILWAAMPLAGGRTDWTDAVKTVALAVGIGVLAAGAVGLGAYLIASNGGPNLVPGLNILMSDSGVASAISSWRTLLVSFALPVVAAIGAGTWWLTRSLPATPRLPRVARWAGLAAFLVVAPAVGIWLAVQLAGMSRPLLVWPHLTLGLLVPMAAAIAAGAGLAAAIGAGANALLRRRGWKVSARGYAAGKAAKGFVAYCAALLLLFVLFRAGDNFVMALGRAVVPFGSAGAGAGAAPTGGLTLAGVGGFALLQAAPFLLFAAITRDTQHEPKLARRMTLAAVAQGAVLVVAIIATLIFWAAAFAMAG